MPLGTCRHCGREGEVTRLSYRELVNYDLCARCAAPILDVLDLAGDGAGIAKSVLAFVEKARGKVLPLK